MVGAVGPVSVVVVDARVSVAWRASVMEVNNSCFREYVGSKRQAVLAAARASLCRPLLCKARARKVKLGALFGSNSLTR